MNKPLIKRSNKFYVFIDSINSVKKKNYIYLNLWSLGCQPCINELPFLLSIGKYINKDINLVFVSPQSNSAVNSFLIKKNISSEQFIFINERMDIIKEILEEIGLTEILLPAHIVIKNTGHILAFYCGPIDSKEDATDIINFINDLE